MRPVDADALVTRLKHTFRPDEMVSIETVTGCFLDETGCAPTLDVVSVAHLEKWLYEIAMNNSDNYLSGACEEIISRLDGLRRFSKEVEHENPVLHERPHCPLVE